MNLEQFKERLKTHRNPVIVDVWAPWCGPCRVTKPILESLASEYEGEVDFLTVNADENSQLLQELRILSIPTVLTIDQGEMLQKFTGVQSRETYRSLFEALKRREPVAVLSMSAFDRLLRLFAGALLIGVGLMTNSWLLLPIGGLIAFLGIHDRCPIWQAIRTQFNKRTP
ncbi:MAG TPA: thioredoxin domain-containing protein [Anaerolineales bacterium]|nr:thioredoxin domain-containing protein [Anaerolineales bacterium]